MPTYEPYNQCGGKFAYDGFKRALYGAKKVWLNKGLVVFPYLCPQCGKYHNGRNAGKKRRSEEQGVYFLSGKAGKSIPIWWNVGTEDDVPALAHGKERGNDGDDG